MRQQSTLRTTVSIEGVGLHSGHPAKANFRPAPPNHGLVFLRRDHPDRPIPARLESASTFDYATTLKHDGVTIGTVEHVLSAAIGVGLDNCLIEIDGPEVPILDGSALPFVRLFHAAGFERQDALVEPMKLTGPVEVCREDRRVLFEPDGPGLTITYEIDFPHPIVGRQELTFTLKPEEFAARIAPARTFGFAREIEVLRLVADGQSNKQIGSALGLSALTVKSHLARIARKLGTGDRAEMVVVAMRAGVVV